ncbi:MAG: PHP domain-containing protein [Anaerolineaceae bacterium]|nr:PHP domain-containing protein [Anaerolineaceae bacterium]
MSIPNKRCKWYRGDFHAHSCYSDGTFEPKALIELEKKENLDFFTITDHNTMEDFKEFDQNLDVLIIPGIEITSWKGHFNVFGASNLENGQQERLGMPYTFVFASELSREAILAGVRKRHVYISKGPTIEISASINEQNYVMGDDLGILERDLLFKINTHSLTTPYSVKVTRNGVVIFEKHTNKSQLGFDHYERLQKNQSGWIRVDIFDVKGERVLLTNPFFFA